VFDTAVPLVVVAGISVLAGIAVSAGIAVLAIIAVAVMSSVAATAGVLVLSSVVVATSVLLTAVFGMVVEGEAQAASPSPNKTVIPNLRVVVVFIFFLAPY
jgi:hypothetical protein